MPCRSRDCCTYIFPPKGAAPTLEEKIAIAHNVEYRATLYRNSGDLRLLSPEYRAPSTEPNGPLAPCLMGPVDTRRLAPLAAELGCSRVVFVEVTEGMKEEHIKRLVSQVHDIAGRKFIFSMVSKFEDGVEAPAGCVCLHCTCVSIADCTNALHFIISFCCLGTDELQGRI